MIENGKKDYRTGATFILLICFFLCLAVSLFYGSVAAVFRAVRASKWQKTPCYIQSCNLQEYKAKHGIRYRIKMSYRYEFKGKEYTSDSYSLIDETDPSITPEERHDFIRQYYGKGKKNFCYVNPKNPEEAVITKKIGVFFIIGTCLCGLFSTGITCLCIIIFLY